MYHYLYDAEGNRIAKFVDVNANGLVDAGDADVTEYSWDHRNRLVRVIQSEGGEDVRWIDYSYDAANQLISRAEAYFDGSNENSIFVYEDGQIVFEFHEEILGSVLVGDLEAQDLLRRLLWGPAVDQLLAEEHVEDLFSLVDNETLWALTDRLGSVRDMVDSNGTLRLHRSFDAFGQITDEMYYDASGQELSPGWFGYVTLAFAYTGRPLDEATGLQNNLNRWYDARVGRWLSEDPLGFAAGDANLYRYVGNEPTTLTDPTGLLAEDPGPGGSPWNDQQGKSSDKGDKFTFGDARDIAVRFSPELEEFLNKLKEGAREVAEENSVLVGAGAVAGVGLALAGGANDLLGTDLPSSPISVKFPVFEGAVGGRPSKLGGSGSLDPIGGGVEGGINVDIDLGGRRSIIGGFEVKPKRDEFLLRGGISF